MGSTKAWYGTYNNTPVEIARADHTHTTDDITGLSSYTILTSTSSPMTISKTPVLTIAYFIATSGNYSRPASLIVIGTGSNSIKLDWTSSPLATLNVTATKITVTSSNISMKFIICIQ